MPRKPGFLNDSSLIDIIQTVLGIVLVVWGIYFITPAYEPSSVSLFYSLPTHLVYVIGGFWMFGGLGMIYIAWRYVKPRMWKFLSYNGVIAISSIALSHWVALGTTSLRWVFPVALMLIMLALALRGQDDR